MKHHRGRRVIRREKGAGLAPGPWGAGSFTWIGLLKALLPLGKALLKALLALREAARHASSLCPWVLLLSSKLLLLLALWVHARLCSVLLLSWKVLGPIGGLLHALGGILGVALGRLLLLGIRCALRREALAAGVWIACVVALLMYLRVPADDERLCEDKVPCWHKIAQRSTTGELTTAWWPLVENGRGPCRWRSGTVMAVRFYIL